VRRAQPILVAALAALGVLVLGGLATDLGPWYRSLEKPAWQPPDWLFGPVWTLIFGFAVAAAVTAWWATPERAQRLRIVWLFALNGALNVLWSVLFFRLQRPDWALVEVGFLWLSIVVLIVVLARHSTTASWLLVPYLAWVSFAGWLNWAGVRLNYPFQNA